MISHCMLDMGLWLYSYTGSVNHTLNNSLLSICSLSVSVNIAFHNVTQYSTSQNEMLDIPAFFFIFFFC